MLEDEEKKSWAESFLEQLNDPLIFILFVAAAISLLLREYGGKVPQAMEDLLRLPGVGRKSANLIRGDIFHLPEQEEVFRDTLACVRWMYRQLEYGCAQYPGFFTHHSLGFMHQGTADGKQQMQQA